MGLLLITIGNVNYVFANNECADIMKTSLDKCQLIYKDDALTSCSIGVMHVDGKCNTDPTTKCDSYDQGADAYCKNSSDIPDSAACVFGINTSINVCMNLARKQICNPINDKSLDKCQSKYMGDENKRVSCTTGVMHVVGICNMDPTTKCDSYDHGADTYCKNNFKTTPEINACIDGINISVNSCKE